MKPFEAMDQPARLRPLSEQQPVDRIVVSRFEQRTIRKLDAPRGSSQPLAKPRARRRPADAQSAPPSSATATTCPSRSTRRALVGAAGTGADASRRGSRSASSEAKINTLELHEFGTDGRAFLLDRRKDFADIAIEPDGRVHH